MEPATPSSVLFWSVLFWSVTFWLGVGLAAIAALVLILWLLHRFCLSLEERGYLYYRKKNSGGGGAGGVLYELDRLTRPSIEHVIQAQDQVVEEDEIDGD